MYKSLKTKFSLYPSITINICKTIFLWLCTRYRLFLSCIYIYLYVLLCICFVFACDTVVIVIMHSTCIHE